MLEKNFIASDELREMRLAEHRIQKEGLMVDDRLESGFIGIYDYIGDCLYLEPQLLEDLLVAGIEIIKSGGKEVGVKRVFYEFGHKELVPMMMGQLKHFHDFYDFSVAFLDLRKIRYSN